MGGASISAKLILRRMDCGRFTEKMNVRYWVFVFSFGV